MDFLHPNQQKQKSISSKNPGLHLLFHIIHFFIYSAMVRSWLLQERQKSTRVGEWATERRKKYTLWPQTGCGPVPRDGSESTRDCILYKEVARYDIRFLYSIQFYGKSNLDVHTLLYWIVIFLDLLEHSHLVSNLARLVL